MNCASLKGLPHATIGTHGIIAVAVSGRFFLPTTGTHSKEQVMADQLKQMLQEKQERLLRLKQVLEIIPLSKSTWWEGCKSGRFPAPIKLTERTTVWRLSDINALLASIGRA
jgi:predicted DNA-binding transcriptional regulator AlpA